MRVHFMGHPALGSYKIRAEQISSADPDWSHGPIEPRPPEAEVYVFVKKTMPALVDRLTRSGALVVFDVLDGWRQPAAGIQMEGTAEAIGWLHLAIRSVRYHGYIFANQAMWADAGTPFNSLTTWIYHHYWPDAKPIEIQTHVKTIGYQGHRGYLGKWGQIISGACARRGIRFVPQMRNDQLCDIGIAVRDPAKVGRVVAQRYKSNVKLANFYGWGMPCLVGQEDSYFETGGEAVSFIADGEDLERELDLLLGEEYRRRNQELLLRERPLYSLESIAREYRSYFDRLARWHSRPQSDTGTFHPCQRP